MKVYNRTICYGIVAFLLLIGKSPAFADISISATPVQGGSSLQFGRQDILDNRQKEVRIRITSTDTNQYQVFQRMIDPLTSTQGGVQNRDVLQYYGIVGSNSAGTLYAQSPEYLSRSEELLFTSAGNGASDRFILAYTIDRDRLSRSGQYYGRVMLSVRPVSGGGSQRDASLDVVLDAELDFTMEITGERSREQIELSNERGSVPSSRVDFSYEGNMGKLKVYQEFTRIPTNTRTGKDFPLSALTFHSQGTGAADMPYVSATHVKLKRDLIYSSDLTADKFQVLYVLDKDILNTLEAGEYSGQLRYVVSGPQGEKEYPFNFLISIKPEFSIQLEFPDGQMKFENLFAGGPAQTFSVVVRVTCNTGKPYAVTQGLMTPLVNERGQRLDSEYFLLSTELLDGSTGKVLLPEFEPVKERGETLFFSDKTGSSAQFRVLYQVRPYAEMEPGDYFTEVRYSLEEM